MWGLPPSAPRIGRGWPLLLTVLHKYDDAGFTVRTSRTWTRSSVPASTPPRGGNAKHRNLGPRPLLAVLLWLIVLPPDRFPSTVEPLCQSLGLFGLVDELLVAIEAKAREVGAANPRKRPARSPEQNELYMEQAGTVVNQPDLAKSRQSLECVRSGVVPRDSGQCAHLQSFAPLLQIFEGVQSTAFRCPSRGDVHSPHRPAL